MDRSELLKSINEVFITVFNDKTINITENSTAGDIKEWDSLNNIKLVVSVEKKLKIRFRADEIRDWQKVGDMCDSILARFP